MKFFAVVALFLFAVTVFAQQKTEILATSTALNFTPESLNAEARQLYEGQAQVVAQLRTRLLYEMANGIILDLESKAQNTTPERLLAAAKTKLAPPTEEQIKEVYDKNREAIGDRSLVEVRPQIVEFLNAQGEQKAAENYINALQLRNKFSLGKDINSPALKPLDTVATVGTRTISAQEFEAKNKFELGDSRSELYEQVRAALEETIERQTRNNFHQVAEHIGGVSILP